jgi:glutathione S-transferase
VTPERSPAPPPDGELRLTLYHYPTCPYCVFVERALRATGITVERENIHRSPGARSELRRATGRHTVPVLKIEERGTVRWLPESRDIVRYLRNLAGHEPPRGGPSRSLLMTISVGLVLAWGALRQHDAAVPILGAAALVALLTALTPRS